MSQYNFREVWKEKEIQYLILCSKESVDATGILCRNLLS